MAATILMIALIAATAIVLTVHGRVPARDARFPKTIAVTRSCVATALPNCGQSVMTADLRRIGDGEDECPTDVMLCYDARLGGAYLMAVLPDYPGLRSDGPLLEVLEWVFPTRELDVLKDPRVAVYHASDRDVTVTESEVLFRIMTPDEMADVFRE